MSDSLSKEAKAVLAGMGLTATGATFAAGKIASTKKRGLRGPTAKTAEKVTNRALNRFNPGGVRGGTSEAAGQAWQRSARAFERKYPKARAASIAKQQANLDKMLRTMGAVAKGASTVAKVAKSVTPAGVVATVMSPTKVESATIYKGFKQKAFKRK